MRKLCDTYMQFCDCAKVSREIDSLKLIVGFSGSVPRANGGGHAFPSHELTLPFSNTITFFHIRVNERTRL